MVTVELWVRWNGEVIGGIVEDVAMGEDAQLAGWFQQVVWAAARAMGGGLADMSNFLDAHPEVLRAILGHLHA